MSSAESSSVRHGASLFVISGCSGSGKSTLLAALAEQGESVALEPGRRVVREEMAAGRAGVPWQDTQRFIELCAATAVADFDRCVEQPQRTFFDRSFIDVAAGVARTGGAAPSCLVDALATRRYATVVLMSPPWPALFTTDEERRHTFADARAEYETLVPTYRSHGYDVVLLPAVPVAERVAFVLATVATQRIGAG